jgi:hypothetical protein
VKEIPPSPTLPLKGGGRKLAPFSFVIAGLDPRLHAEPPHPRVCRMDARVKPAHDEVIPHPEEPTAGRRPEGCMVRDASLRDAPHHEEKRSEHAPSFPSPCLVGGPSRCSLVIAGLDPAIHGEPPHPRACRIKECRLVQAAVIR